MTAATPASSVAAPASPLAKHHFLLRRLHSLSGIVPVGVFVIMHLFTNAQMIMDPAGDTFQHEVNFIHSIPALLFVEIALWGGIGFHAALGLWYTFTGKSNVSRYSYADNVRYTLQRVTGIVALVFIFFHIATLRWRWDILFIWDTPFYALGHDVPGLEATLGHAMADVPLSMPLTAYALQYSVWVALLYLVGVVAVVYHWSNGLWTAAISWGLTVSTQAMRRWGYCCAGLFVVLMVFFLAAFVGALRYDFDEMRAEQKAAMLFTVGDGVWAFEDEARLEADLNSLGITTLQFDMADEPAERPIVEPSETPDTPDTDENAGH